MLTIKEYLAGTFNTPNGGISYRSNEEGEKSKRHCSSFCTLRSSNKRTKTDTMVIECFDGHIVEKVKWEHEEESIIKNVVYKRRKKT